MSKKHSIIKESEEDLLKIIHESNAWFLVTIKVAEDKKLDIAVRESENGLTPAIIASILQNKDFYAEVQRQMMLNTPKKTEIDTNIN